MIRSFKLGLGALVTTMVLAVGGAQAFDVTAMTDKERAAFRAEIRAYLLDNPEVIFEAVDVYEKRQQAAQAGDDIALINAHAKALFDDGYSWVGGNPEGAFALVEFIDYRCGYCRRAHPEVAQLIESDGDIRLIVKELPILGEDSVRASRFAIAVRMEAGAEAYKSAHDRLITMRAGASNRALRALADDLDLDTATIFATMDSDVVSAEIRANRVLAQNLKINGTPAFVFETQMLRGYAPLDQMQGIVARVRAQ